MNRNNPNSELICTLFMFELGDGWRAAILDNQREYDFVKVAQKGVVNNKSYWIGGSTSQAAWNICHRTQPFCT